MRIFGFAGWSGSGKTTLIEQHHSAARRTRARVSLVKHAHHRFDIDQPGKDSYRHRASRMRRGPRLVGVALGADARASRRRRNSRSAQALARLSTCDIALVEGYKAYPIPKLEVWRAQWASRSSIRGTEHIVAVATDSPDALPAESRPRLPVLALSDYDGIATLVVDHATASPVRH